MKNTILFLFLIATINLSCYKNPVTGKKEFLLVSESQEIAMGKSYDPQVISTFGLYEDEKLQKFITEKGMKMAKLSHRPDLPYEFKVVDSPVVNAFAVPGGFVYFTRGIMAHFNNEAEFAGVLGHEIGHITAKHTAKQQTGQILGQIGLIAGVVIKPELAQYADVAQQGMQLLFLKFSRDHESQSDRLGVAYSTKAGYDAVQMADFFQTIKRIGEKSGQSVPTMLSTHPDPGDRNAKVKILAQKAQQNVNKDKLIVNRDGYLKMIDGIVYGEDPRQGFVENGNFYHPELKFQFPIPNGWQTQNSPSQFQMAPKDGNAVLMLTLAQGKTLNEAKQKTIEQMQLQVQSSNTTRVNGFPALEMVSVQANQQQAGGTQTSNENQVVIFTTLIEYGGLVYAFHGLTYQKFINNYKSSFDRTRKAFNSLSDPSKLNRQPERISVVTAPRTANLKETLQEFGMKQARMEELAILNGMQLTDRVNSGTLLKIVK
ncbi:MAG: M48 family metalloprotease [Saprospiraceae bacterium]